MRNISNLVLNFTQLVFHFLYIRYELIEIFYQILGSMIARTEAKLGSWGFIKMNTFTLT